MCAFRGHRADLLVLGLMVCLFCGCADGPFGGLAGMNPWIRQQWNQDEQYGPTYHKRLAELKLLRSQAGQLSAAEQQQFVGQLTELVRTDPNPVMRAEAVRTLAAFPAEMALPTLRVAAADEDPDVRIIACRVWGEYGGPESLQALSEVVRSDGDVDVKIAATAELGSFQDQVAVQALAVALDENDPALQYEAVQSLKSATGRDFGDNVPAWREYVAGRTPMADDQPSVVERLRRLF
jgi:hypothetical protein